MDALRQILAVFSVDNSSLKKGITEGNRLVDELKNGLSAMVGPLAAAFGGAAIIGFTRDMITVADETAKTADVLGLGILELQEWQHAAGLSGVATEQVTTSITKLGQKIAQASSGNAEMAKTFKALGLDMDVLAETADRSLGDAFQMVGLSLAGLEDKAQRTDLAMKLFEESGPKLFNLFKGGSESIDAMKREVTELGIAFDDDFAHAAESFDDNMDRLTKSGKGLLMQVLKPLLPEMVDLTEQMVKLTKEIVPVVKQVVSFVKNSRLLEAAVVMLAGKTLLSVATFWKLAGALKFATSAAFRFLLPLLAIDDIIGFLAGDDSSIGRRLDEWFGEGTAEKVRASIQDLADEAVRLFGRFETEVLPVVREFADETIGRIADVKDAVVSFGEEWGPAILKVTVALGSAVLAFKATVAVMALWKTIALAAAVATNGFTAATVGMKVAMLASAVASKVAAGAVAIFNAVVLANPVALVVAGIVGALALIVAFWPEISGFFSDLWGHVKVIGGNISDWFGEVWAKVSATFANFVSRTKGGAQFLWASLRLVWTNIKFAGLAAAASLSDAFGNAWNSILEGAKRVMGVYANLVSYIPGIGDEAADGVRKLAGELNGLSASVDAGAIVQGDYEEARKALVAELEVAAARMQEQPGQSPLAYSAPASNVTTNVTQDVNNKTEVHVTVPPSTPANVAARVGAAAQRGAQQGSARNLRATQDALVPRPAG